MKQLWSAPTVTRIACPALALCLAIVISTQAGTIRMESLVIGPEQVAINLPAAQPQITVNPAGAVTINTNPVTISGAVVTVCPPVSDVKPQ